MTSDGLVDLYRQQVLQHAREPRHFRRGSAAAAQARGNNPLCGDQLEVFVSRGSAQLDELCFEGSGCAISMASASMMTEMLAGAQRETALATVSDVLRMLAAPEPTPLPATLVETPVAALSAVRRYPSRVKCASLAWRALDSALHDDGDVSTE